VVSHLVVVWGLFDMLPVEFFADDRAEPISATDAMIHGEHLQSFVFNLGHHEVEPHRASFCHKFGVYTKPLYRVK